MKTMFPLGHIAITPTALEAMQQVNISPDSILQRHVLGDWGDLTDGDKKTDELAIAMGGLYRLTTFRTEPRFGLRRNLIEARPPYCCQAKINKL